MNILDVRYNEILKLLDTFQIVAFYHFESYNSIIFVLFRILNTGKVIDKLYLNYISLNICACYLIFIRIILILVEIVL